MPNAVFTNVTARQVILLALKDAGVIGVGQTALAEDINDTLFTLNQIIAQWNRKRWLIWALETLEILSTGADFYTIGPVPNVSGANHIYRASRPDKIESAFFRQQIQSNPNRIDYPLEIITSREDYNKIALKTLQSFPSYLFYDTAWPTGNLYPWPVPQANLYSLHFSVKVQFTGFTSLAQELGVPPEYVAALRYTLGMALRPTYQLPPDPQLRDLMVNALNTLRKANTQIGRLDMPAEISRPGIYNPYSDTVT